jgi:hypothetical protein
MGTIDRAGLPSREALLVDATLVCDVLREALGPDSDSGPALQAARRLQSFANDRVRALLAQQGKRVCP